MRHEHARHAAASSRATPRAWLDVARVVAATASLGAALWVATRVASRPALFAAFLALGVLAFAALLVALGRDISGRWLAFGASHGFTPCARRSAFDLGTDRPPLHGNLGPHATRLRLVVEGREAWLHAEVDLLARPGLALDLRARRLGARVRDGRLLVRAPFPGADEREARAFLDKVRALADALVDEGEGR